MIFQKQVINVKTIMVVRSCEQTDFRYNRAFSICPCVLLFATPVV